MACVAAIWFGSVASAADTAGQPELRGMLVAGGGRQFALAIPGGESAWAEVGGRFAGWTLKEYRAESDELVLVRDGRETVLKLASSKIGERVSTKATVADAEAVLDKMRFAEMFARIFEQQKQAAIGMMQKMTGGAKGVNPEALAAFQTKVMDVMFAELSPEGMKADVAKLYSDVFTKEELRGLADFYSTDAGRAMIDKQPEVSRRMNEIMLPRIMAAMPKVQKLAAEFAKEQAAAAKPAAPAEDTAKP